MGGWVEPVPSSARHPPLSALQAETEEAFSTRYLEVTSSCRAMLASGLAGDAATRGGSGSSHAEELVELLSRVTRLYMALLQLENFAVLNYCGFGKILVSGLLRPWPPFSHGRLLHPQSREQKKHDKVSGFVTKSRFMQRLVHPQAFTHTRRLQRMLRGSENCYSMLVAALSASGLRHEGLSGQDAAALADLRATNEAVARQRSLEDDPESASDAAEEPADGAGLGRGGAAAVPTREAGSVASSASAAAPAAASPSEASPTAPATRKRRRNEAQTGVA